MATNSLPDDIEHWPRARILEVEYVHVALPDGDDLYLTTHGLPFAAQLLPENYWTDKSWFRANSRPLPGTSTLYHIRTKPSAGGSREIVLKWNRMAQDVPGETMAHELSGAEFNSPFEEFSLTTELRGTRYESPGAVLTHKPLAIYVPRGRMDLERLGRKQYKFEAKQDSHQGVFLDMHRRYAVIYEWIKGIDAAQACREGLLGREELDALLGRSEEEMRWKGFVVHDNKAQHLIVRPDGRGGVLRGRKGEIVYANIDFELLQRTPRREEAVRAAKRRTYLTKQAHRFEAETAFPPHLTPTQIFGVDYVFGQVESTGGALWVVGKDPVLFDYFLPEQWRRTPRTRLSVISQTYHTTTKDNVRLVWKVSRVGETPDLDPFHADEKRILDYGYNSPFEEVALSLELSQRGIPSVYPRAIYMTGSKSDISRELSDDRRYHSHAALTTPAGHPILRQGRNYIILWGFWNGPDELLAQRDEERCRGISALQACREGIVDEQTYLRVMHVARSRLEEVGVEDLNLRGNHLLLSLTPDGELMTDPDRLPTIRICNFELLRRVRGGG